MEAVVSERPAGIPESAHALWDDGVADKRVRPGDLWILSWDGAVVGLAVIAAAKHGFVLAWPVTLPGEVSFSPGLVVDDSPLGRPVTLWATRETGIGNHLLDRNLGRLLEPDRIRSLSFALDHGDDPGLTFAPDSVQSADNADADRVLIEHWTDLCFNTGGAEEGVFLDSSKLQQAGGTARIVGEALGVGPQEVRPLLTGVLPISAVQLETVAQRLHVESESLIGTDPLADVVTDLAQPSFKRHIVLRTAETGIGEEAIRRHARREFALAARNDADALRETKLRDAINRAGRDGK